MKRNYIFLIIVGLLAYNERHKIRNFFDPPNIPTSVVQTPQCLGKKKCGVIYMAPWCPACNSMIPQLKVLLDRSQNHQDFGIQVIVGNGKSMIDNQMKAQEIGEKVITDDENGTFAKNLNVTYFPTLFVLDQSAKVIAKDRDALVLMQETFSK